MYQRILKTIAALGVGQVINILSQLALPPVFLAAYGINGYGEWIVLSAAVGYLTALDFGLQNYLINQLTMLFHAGRHEECRQLQSVGLRLMTGFLAVGTMMAGTAFFLPVNRWLGLALHDTEAPLCLFLLAVQILGAIVFGQFNGTYRAFGQAPRGAHWGNACRLTQVACALGLAAFGVSFWLIALVQLLAMLAISTAMMIDLARQAPSLFPSWGLWDGSLARTVLRQSAFFALFTVNNFILYQWPLLAINRLLGNAEVVAFSVARMLFSLGRQVTGLLQGAITPEISRLQGSDNRVGLRRLHSAAEATVLSSALVINVTILVMAPLVLKLWLHQPDLFDVRIYVTLMAIMAVTSAKDCKLYFQYATNTHVRASLVSSAANVLLAVLLIPGLQAGGIFLFLVLWLALEIGQLLIVHGFNDQLLGDREHNLLFPVVKFAALLTAATAAVVGLDLFWRDGMIVSQGFIACGCVALIALAAFVLFNLKKTLTDHLWVRLRA